MYAASDGGNTGVTIGGYDKELQPFIYVDFLCGSWGGRPWADGLDGNTNMFANMASFSVEVIEAENPLEVLDYEFVPDSGGAGKFRGGMAQRKTWRMLADEGILQVRADRQTHRPYGLQGGVPGAPGRNVLDVGLPTEAPLHAKLTMTLRRGQVFRHELPGSGGWGDPLARDLALVAQDLRDGLVTIEARRTRLRRGGAWRPARRSTQRRHSVCVRTAGVREQLLRSAGRHSSRGDSLATLTERRLTLGVAEIKNFAPKPRH